MKAPSLYLDEDVDPLLACVLLQREVDVLTTHEAGRRAATDADQLAFAVREGRAILTHNVAHFAALALRYRRAGWEHHGVVLSDQVPFKQLLARALRLLDRYTADSLRNQLVWLQDFQ